MVRMSSISQYLSALNTCVPLLTTHTSSNVTWGFFGISALTKSR